jgi:hypothetical protein
MQTIVGLGGDDVPHEVQVRQSLQGGKGLDLMEVTDLVCGQVNPLELMEAAQTIEALDQVVRETQAFDVGDDPDQVGEDADSIVRDVEDPQLVTVLEMDDVRDVVVAQVKMGESREVMKRAVEASQTTVGQSEGGESLPEINGFDLRDLIVERHRL